LNSFKDCNQFTDVTLVCSDALEYNAHQFMLKNASSVFENILQFKNEVSPTVYLPEITSKGMIVLLEFIYHGKVLISNEEEMKDFYQTASYLKLKMNYNCSAGDLVLGIPSLTQMNEVGETENFESIEKKK